MGLCEFPQLQDANPPPGAFCTVPTCRVLLATGPGTPIKQPQPPFSNSELAVVSMNLVWGEQQNARLTLFWTSTCPNVSKVVNLQLSGMLTESVRPGASVDRNPGC